VVGLMAVVSSLTALQRVGAVPLASLSASPREVADGRLWLLVTSGAVAADPLLWSLLSFYALAFLTLALCGQRILWLAAVIGQAFSTLLGYSLIGVARLLDPGAFHELVVAPDYGLSAISAAWLGAIAAIGWRTRRQSIGRAAVVLGCVATACLAWFVRGRGLDLLDSEHVFAFAIGVGVAIGLVLGEPIRLPRVVATRPWIGPSPGPPEVAAAGSEPAPRSPRGAHGAPCAPETGSAIDRPSLRT